MTNSLPPIQSLWIGRPLSTIERLCIRSFQANGHPFHLYTYDKVENVPEGTVIKDATAILGRERIFQVTEGWGKGSYAPFADLFRLEMLHQIGGWWVDMDMVCLRPVTLAQPNVVATTLEWKHGVLPNSNVLRFEPGHHFLKTALKHFHDSESTRYMVGVEAVKSAAGDINDPSLLAAPEAFNPISWRYLKYINGVEEGIWHPRRIKRMLGITPPVGRITENSWMVHLWNEFWTQCGHDREGTYHPDSLFERLKKRYMT